MGLNIQIERATMFDAIELAPYIRESDRQEIWAAGHLLPEQALVFCLQNSEASYTVRIDGYIIMMFGVSSTSIGGAPWMLATPDLEGYAVKFYHTTREAIEIMLEQYGYLENYVDARNIKSIRWLKWLGFTIHDAQPYGIDRLPFRRFSMKAGE